MTDARRRDVGRRDQVIGVSPLGEPDPRLAAAVSGAGALGVLDLGSDPAGATRALRLTARLTESSFGVWVSRLDAVDTDELARHRDRIDTLLVAGSALADAASQRLLDALPDARVLAEVTSVREAVAAVAAGADGLLARGNEAGGRVGELSSFVLLQQVLEERELLGDEGAALPVWCWGGMGVRTAVAAVVGGAAGIVLDTQLSLLREATVTEPVGSALRRMDGTETVVAAGYRVYQSPAGRRASGNAEDWPAEAVAARLGGQDPGRQLLPVGQDAFLAQLFANRFGTTARAVQAIRAALRASTGSAELAAAESVLATDSPLCASWGTTRPVAQGPMTRVSDQAGFARRVAVDGALPFLALALADAEQSRRLLLETRDLLGERPWGVGLLGFAPEDLRASQLEVVREIRPSCVIVAGGRPSQAADLEAIGIPTFLHVPSPTLLRQFLDAGCRRFVFEGSECGGHVGPRASFPLWEAQLDVLLDYLDRTSPGARTAGSGPRAQTGLGLQVLFAGGVHDARSASMVAAMASPVAARGVGVGVLMGTAYLFTREAVELGAIQDEFQRQVVAARGTALLRTGPGHATRCVTSPFVDRFHAARDELRARGVPDQQAWEALERLNVGRLRVASKGLERHGDELAAVDGERQRAEGLFMAGQVAVLRSAATTIHHLHDDVTSGARRFLRDQAEWLWDGHGPAAASRASQTAPLDIAVVGMACVLPGAADLATYWANVVSGKDAVSLVPPERWDPEVYLDTDADHDGGPSGEKTRSKWGGFLPRIPFDPLRYGIPPASLASIEPVQALALETARRALDDAGLDPDRVNHIRTGVVFGTEPNSDLSAAITLRALLPAYYGEVPPELRDVLPRITAETFTGILGNIVASRISNRLDLGGPAYVVDAACASSLAALDMACKELRFGGADVMICGGADLHNGVLDYLLFSSVGALSPTGRARPFAADADGTTLGEGVACVVLKRLADAERDGDRVYAVVKGLGAASDGRSLGLTAPRPEGQQLALERAYHNAGLSPADVGLVEAHGTGTVVGDRAELTTLTRVFTEAGARPGTCALGSVKSQIGHTKTAAGLAALVKTSLALHHGVLPPTLHVETPNPAWEPDDSPFVLAGTARPWTRPVAERVAGVSAFGFGGANYHAVLAGHAGAVDARHALDQWPAELFVFRGADQAAALAGVAELRRLLVANDAGGRPWPLRDLAATATRRARPRRGLVRIAVVARDLDDLAHLLERAARGESDPRAGLFAVGGPSPGAPDGVGGGGVPGGAGAVAVLFPGQGSQRPGMLAELFVAFPELRDYLRLGEPWRDAIFPPSTFDGPPGLSPGGAGSAEERLRDTRVAQPALGIAGLGVYHLLSRLGLAPDMTAGHSYGELVALCAAGAYDPETLLDLSAARGEAIVRAVTGVASQASAGGTEPPDQGAMAAVRAPLAVVASALAETRLAEQVVVANHNAPDQVVISGATPAVEAMIRLLRDAGHSAIRLPVACAFHSPLIAGAGPEFAQRLAGAPLSDPRLPVWSNRTAEPYPATDGVGAAGDAVRAELAAQVAAPVRFVDQIEAMYAAGARVFVEAGPGRVLTGLVDSILGDRPHLAVACDGRRRGLTGFLDAVATLLVADVPLSVDWLVDGRDAVDRDGATAPTPPRWSVDGRSICRADGEPLPGGLLPAARVRQAGPPTLVAATTTLSLTGVPTPRHAAADEPAVGRPAAALAALGGTPSPAGQAIPAGQETSTGGAANHTIAPATREALVSQFLRTSRDNLAAQRDVLLSYLGAGRDAATALSTAARMPAADGLVASSVAHSWTGGPGPVDLLARPGTAIPVGPLAAPADTPIAIAAAAAVVPSAPAGAQGDVTATVLDLIAESTGYPTDMIEIDLDLETDLSVNSLKRTELAGQFVDRFTLTGAGGVDELSRLRTVRAIVGWLTEHTGTAAGSPEPPTIPAEPAAPTELTAPARPAGGARNRGPTRFVLTRRPASPAAPGRVDLTGTTWTVFGRAADVPGRKPIMHLLAELGAEARFKLVEELADGDQTAPDGAVYLAGWGDGGGEPELPDAFGALRAVVRGGPRWLLAVTPPDAMRAAGLRGLFRTLGREYPTTTVKLVETDAAAGPALTDAVAAELGEPPGGPVVVVHRDGARLAEELTAVSAGALATAGAGPADDGTAEATALGLDRDAVVVLVGGARGITAGFTALLAGAAGCHLELAGRTPEPVSEEDPRLAAATDRAALLDAVRELGHRSAKEASRAVAQVLAQREIRATLATVAARGGDARYHQLDVLDTEAVHRFVKQVFAHHGRIDAVVYSAGVIEDRLVADKEPESFRRVFDTKVAGARALLAAFDELPVPPRTLAFFGSIAGVMGSRGQSDYAAANDALETLGAAWARRTGSRALTVHWGPWAPDASHPGMVSADLERDFARRGVDLIDPEEGHRCLLRELAWGPRDIHGVVYTASGW
ncbi:MULTISPECIES: type I polyketide synthase [unclassified Pseudofrankia]|uniref:type I polyketide synthase n=1 Tax=unclassified Pseudofrankia TaxID=2994372 RepID=UPI0008DB256B|nr:MULTISPECIES: type I polyketide synthase [unclassified Pseudofrankia]MDT3442965.1 type I polyketide synthase [Pseudofrankia sp. BMG5.37]OHV42998.1 polyketide synthase [Pseudofrankia sp. BMG5.36]